MRPKIHQNLTGVLHLFLRSVVLLAIVLAAIFLLAPPAMNSQTARPKAAKGIVKMDQGDLRPILAQSGIPHSRRS
jgi:hypothetical protein